ncbi:MAG: hypothetical protein ACJAYU_004732 [Bradymonadia bacterium]
MGLNSDFTVLTGHSSNLPASANQGQAWHTDEAMTSFPFYTLCLYHRGVGAGGR